MATKRRLRVYTYRVVARAVEEGVAYGLCRYNKYTEKPIDVDLAAEHIEREVMNVLCDVIDFDEPT